MSWCNAAPECLDTAEHMNLPPVGGDLTFEQLADACPSIEPPSESDSNDESGGGDQSAGASSSDQSDGESSSSSSSSSD
eukprot:5490513-Pyramimonas_sp.AAC.1